jgi:hypothetical protein
MSYIEKSDLKYENEIIQEKYDNKIILNEQIEKNEENLINNIPVVRKHSSNIIKSPKRDLLELSEKKNLGDINSLIKSRFKNPKYEDYSESQFFLNLLVPANVNFFRNIFNNCFFLELFLTI